VKKKDKMTTNHTYAKNWPLVIITHKNMSVWISSEENTSIQVYNKKKEKKGKRRSRDRYRWKQKERRVYIHKCYECVMLRKIEVHIYRMKNIISSRCLLTTFWCFEQEEEWHKNGNEQREKKRHVKYIHRKWNKTITNIYCRSAHNRINERDTQKKMIGIRDLTAQI